MMKHVVGFWLLKQGKNLLITWSGIDRPLLLTFFYIFIKYLCQVIEKKNEIIHKNLKSYHACLANF